jgi:hypothetical protein
MFFRKSCRVWEILEKYGGASDVKDNITRRRRFLCWITKTKHILSLSEYEILVAFPQQQWFLERVSLR